MAEVQQQSDTGPRSWSDYLNTYRSVCGSRAYSTATGEPQVRFTRSVAGVCPLAEIKHPLYSVGTAGTRALSTADGSFQRAQWHGWGDVSLLKEEGYQGQVHSRGVLRAVEGKKPVQQPLGKDGRKGLFGLLQRTEAGGVDSWIGNMLIDPTKGKRAISAPTDEKRTVGLTQLLAQTAPGSPASDAWIGHLAIDPAKGKGRCADPSSLRGRPDLFAVLQQQILQQQQQPGSDSSSSSAGRLTAAAQADAWIGNRLLQPNKGKKPVDLPEGFQDHLHAATFKAGLPADGCFSDLPPVGRRPLEAPSNAAGFVTAKQAMRIEPCLEGASLAQQQPNGMRYIPYGGIAQEKGMTMDTLAANRSQARQLSGSGGPAASQSGSFRGSTGGSGRSKQQSSMGGLKRGAKAGGRQP
ncbi:hypothetical protein COO60DRAFT_1702977 [Scenedesmus sp. NREL 46B-D3]|nr:hypothetical protein COO60DRAFT_1702977 [Scenedesmus sp. NREL 46B-D3]